MTRQAAAEARVFATRQRPFLSRACRKVRNKCRRTKNTSADDRTYVVGKDSLLVWLKTFTLYPKDAKVSVYACSLPAYLLPHARVCIVHISSLKSVHRNELGTICVFLAQQKAFRPVRNEPPSDVRGDIQTGIDKLCEGFSRHLVCVCPDREQSDDTLDSRGRLDKSEDLQKRLFTLLTGLLGEVISGTQVFDGSVEFLVLRARGRNVMNSCGTG